MALPQLSKPRVTILFTNRDGDAECRDFPDCRLRESADVFRVTSISTQETVFVIRKALCAFVEQAL